MKNITKKQSKDFEKKAIEMIVGFGTSDRAERMGLNPKTGEKLKISARTVPTFKAGKALKEKVK
jgi:DNA-binding protein HU-beta